MTTQHAKSNAREGDGVAEAVSALSRLHARLVRNLEIDALLGDMAHSLRSAAEITALAQAIAAMQAQQGAEPVAWLVECPVGMIAKGTPARFVTLDPTQAEYWRYPTRCREVTSLVPATGAPR